MASARQKLSFIRVAAFFALFLLGILPARSAEPPRVRLAPADARGKWGPWLEEAAGRALERAEARLGLKLDRPVEIYSQPDELAFERDLGERVHRIVAVARPERAQIAINRPAWLHENPPRQEQVLLHEMTHLIIGRRVPGRLPAWLDEGLAMTVAGEGGFDNSWRVLVAGTLGTLIPVEMLMDRVTIGEDKQDLAYAQSLSLTQFYIRRQFPGRRGLDPAPLLRQLADPQTGRKRVQLLWDPLYATTLEQAWRQGYHTLWSTLLFLSSTSLLWIAITLLFLLTWWRKRRLARAIRERFERDEHWEAEFGGTGLVEEWQEPAAEEWDEDESGDRRP